MRRYIRIYNACIKIGIQRMLAYRFDSWASTTVATFVWSFLTIFTMFALVNRTKGMFGWSANELIVLSCIYNVFVGLVSFFFARNFEEFSELVNHGKLDEMFLKPVDSQFLVSLRRVHITSLIRTVGGIIISIILMHNLGIRTDLMHTLAFTISIVFGILIIYSIFFMLNTINIWYTRLDNINQLFYTLRGIGRYPRTAFAQVNELIFVLASPFVIPLATPVRILFGKATPYEVIELIVVSVLLFAASRIFWRYALHSYTSASG